jgi:putative aldouronate transport system permease protein
MVGKNRITIYTLFKYLFVAGFSVVIIYPLLHVLAVSFSENIHILTRSITFYPKGFKIDAYRVIWESTGLAGAYLNTLKYVTGHTILAMLVTTTAAYALSKGRRMWGFGFFTSMILVSMFFSAGIIPQYLTMRSYNLINTGWAVVILGCASPFNIIVMKTFFQNLPKELEDAGKIDGLNDFGVLRHIALPLSSAVMSTLALFYAVGQWNAYMTPFIYLTQREKWPVQILLRQMLIAGQSFNNDSNAINTDSYLLGESLVNATIIVSIIPMIVIYPFLQKYFAKGVMIGSIKG